MNTQMPDFTFKHVNQVDEPVFSASDLKDHLDSQAREIRNWFNATHIGTDKIHLGALGFVAGTTISPTTTSVTYVDLPEMSIPIITAGGDILVFFSGVLLNSGAGNSILLQLYCDVTGGGAISQVASVAGYGFNMTTVCRFTGIAAGAHTIKAQWAVSAGTGTAFSVYRYLMALEVKQ